MPNVLACREGACFAYESGRLGGSRSWPPVSQTDSVGVLEEDDLSVSERVAGLREGEHGQHFDR